MGLKVPKTKKGIIKEIVKFRTEFQVSFYTIEKRRVIIRVYFSSKVFKLVRILKESKIADRTVVHDSLRALFGPIIIRENFDMEKTVQKRKIDIYIPSKGHKVEIKTISEMTIEKLELKVKKAYSDEINYDFMWNYYFMYLDFDKLKEFEEDKERDYSKIKCKYFLIFIEINLIGVIDLTEINNEIEKGTEEMIEQVAKELDVSKNIIIPLPNLITVEELRSEIDGLKSDVEELKSKNVELKSDVKELKSKNVELKSDVEELKSEVEKRDKIIKELRDKLKEAENSRKGR